MNKKLFENRENNFWELMAKNAEVKTLTEEQHATLADLANLRHKLHTSQSTLFNDEADNKQLWTDYENINETLTKCNLETIDILAIEDFTTTINYEIDNEGLTFEDWYNEYFPVFVEEIEAVNKSIESYLENIDKKHGTKYAPTGKTRLY